MPTQATLDAQKLVERGRSLRVGKWHEIARIRDATVYLVRSEPRDPVPDFDTHADADEMVVVLDGEFRVETPDGIAAAGPGESLFVPSGMPHRGRHRREAIFLLIR